MKQVNYFWFTIVFIIITCQTNIFCQQIYLSPTGDDADPGTKALPLATLNAARDKAREYRKENKTVQPVEIIASEGEYFMMQPLELTADDAGSTESPLVIKAEPGKKAVFRGGVRITGWEMVNNNLWRAFVPQVAYYNSYFEQLYVNGNRAVRARTPNEGFYFIKSVNETIIESGSEPYTLAALQEIVFDSADALTFNSFSGEDLRDAFITFYHKWDNTRKRILKFSNAKTSIFIAGTGMIPWNVLDKNTRYYIDNFRSALDAPGEWYLERSGYLYYIPKPGETIQNISVYAPVLKEFIVIRGDPLPGNSVENVRFENLTFEVAGYRTPPDGIYPAQAAALIDAAITLDFAKNISFNNCEISHTGTYAFWFRRAAHQCTVSQCYIHDLGAGGVKIGETIIRPVPDEITSNITIDNNIIRSAGHIFPCAVGIVIFHSSDNTLSHNEIADMRYSGISAGWSWGYGDSPSKRNKIEFNHIHHLGWGELCDMGGIYTLGVSEGTTVSNNVIHHVYSFGKCGGWGLYTDEGSSYITFENNLVYSCKDPGFHQHYGKENIIRNNIIALNLTAQLRGSRIEEYRSFTFTNNIVYFNTGTLLSTNWHKYKLQSDYNCYWDTRTKDVRFAEQSFSDWKKSGKDEHSIIANPQFVDPLAYDFHLKNMSVARKINFKPFDYTKAGVYGSDAWKKLAETDPEMARRYDERIAGLESKNLLNR